jgi:hypothetical protein
MAQILIINLIPIVRGYHSPSFFVPDFVCSPSTPKANKYQIKQNEAGNKAIYQNFWQ